MNLVGSLVESYLYADMFNREYQGGSTDVQEKVFSAGLPVGNIVPSIGNTLKNTHPENHEQNGGQKTGPFSNKVIPVGLILIQNHKESDVEYENHFHPGMKREVVPESLYEMLVGSVLMSSKRRRTPPKHHSKKRTSHKKHKESAML
jgi:hypothetical protein